MYKIDNFYTNFGYVISIRNGKIYEIVDNMSKLKAYTYSMLLELNDIELNEIRKEAITQLNILNNSDLERKNILKQYHKYFLDIDNNKKYVRIFTEYLSKDNSKDLHIFEKAL